MPKLKPGDIVDTPHGRGKLLHPVRRTQRREWVVIIGTKGHAVNVDEMAETGTRSEDMSTEGTCQTEMGL